MAHGIERRNGIDSVFTAGELPWHKLGQNVEGEKTSEAAIKLAYMDTICEKRPIYLAGQNLVDGIPVIGPEITDKFAVVRTCDNQPLGVVGKKYEIIQNVDAFNFLDSLVGEGLAMFHTAGSLHGGRKIFITCKLPGSLAVGPDLIDKFLFLHMAHDGTMSMHCRFTPIRVVCANTVAVSMRGEAKNQVSIKHTRNWRDMTVKAREMLGLADIYYSRMEQEFSKLLDKEMNLFEMRKFTETLIPNPLHSYQAERTREQIVDLFNSGIGHDQIASTRWAAFSAVTEYVDHHRKVRNVGGSNPDENRFSGIMNGNGEFLRQKAYALLSN